MYATITRFLEKFIKRKYIFQYAFNLSPMYRRSTGRVYFVSEDLHDIKVRIKLSYRNVNYVGTIFGGSMASATDPIYMIQLMFILQEKYIVWDKAVNIRFKRPAKETAYAHFEFSTEEVDAIKQAVEEKGEVDWVKKLNLTNKDGSVVFAEVEKTIYIASKAFYKEKRKKKLEKAQE